MRSKRMTLLLELLVLAIAAVFVVSYINQAIAKEKMLTMSGQVTSVDNAAKTLTVKGKTREATIAWDQMTQVTMGKEKKALDDLRAGDKVKVTYHEKENKLVANSILIKSLPSKMNEKSLGSEKVHG